MNAAEKTASGEVRSEAFRDVFVPQDESEASLRALGYADGLCIQFGAHLSGLMVGLVPYYPMSLASSANPEGWIHAQQQASEEASLSERRLRTIYSALSSHNELKRVDAFEQEVGRLCARRARTADLTVMGWSPGGGDLERAVFEGCLFESGRPVVLVTPTAAFHGSPKRALVAWNGSREAARALREALPLLRRARLTRIVVVDAENHEIGDFQDTIDLLARNLTRHEVAVETRHVPSRGRDVALTLSEEAEQFGAGILVLGGYGYPRSGRWVYGGTTASALQLARVPLFFAH